MNTRGMIVGIALIVTMSGAIVTPAVGEEQVLTPDVVVAGDGSGDFASIQAAVDSLAEGDRDRVVILVKDGVYEERIRIDRDRVTIRGESREGTRIEFPLLHSDFEQNPDDIGRGVININGDDVIIENLTVANTQPRIGPHAFTIFGRGTRTIVQDANVLSNGADTLALWNAESGMYYHANCHLRGAVDYVCPRGWCYITDSTFEQVGGSAGIWHSGDRDPEQKLVIRSSHFDGYEGFRLGRHHRDAAFYLLDATFSENMRDENIYRVTYPDEPERDAPNRWGHRVYYHNATREAGDFEWHADNLHEAPGAPRPEEVTAAWTFGGRWDPESTEPPKVAGIDLDGRRITVRFDEDVSVKEEVRLALADGREAVYASGSGGQELLFVAPPGNATEVRGLAGDGVIIAAVATRRPRVVTELE